MVSVPGVSSTPADINQGPIYLKFSLEFMLFRGGMNIFLPPAIYSSCINWYSINPSWLETINNCSWSYSSPKIKVNFFKWMVARIVRQVNLFDVYLHTVSINMYMYVCIHTERVLIPHICSRKFNVAIRINSINKQI